MFVKRIVLVFACMTLSVLMGCGSSGGGDDLDIAEIQEIEQTGEFSEDEFFASDDVETVDEEQLVEEVPGLEEDLEVTQEELEASGEEPFEVDLAEEEEDLFAESGLADEGFEDELEVEAPIAENNTIDDGELDDLLEEDLGEVVVENDTAEVDSIKEDSLALEAEEDLFRDMEEGSEDVVATGETFMDSTEEPSASELLAEDDMSDLEDIDYTGANETAANYNEPSASQMISEDIDVDVDYSQSLAEDQSLEAYSQAETPEKSWVPVKKMKTVPYDRNGILVNAIYFVREGDTLSTIANKIYGSGSAVDFTIVNPHLKPGNLKVGQKVYYNSPQRPQDRSRLLTFYEDVSSPVKYYSANQGENIREISASLLGHPRSWLEVWASNMEIQSKTALEAPFQVRYWEGASGAAVNPQLAQKPVDTTPSKPSGAVDSDLGSESQANLDMGSESELGDVSGDFDDPVQDLAAVDDGFSDESLEEPVLEEPEFTDELAGDLAAVGSIDEPSDKDFKPEDELGASFDEEIALDNKEMGSNKQKEASANPRDVALNQNQGFKAQNQGGIAGILNDPAKLGIIGGALLLLLGLAFVVIRRRRAGADEAIEMESFDFGGETVIDDELDKTQVDL